MQLNDLVHDDSLLLVADALLLDALQVVPIVIIVRNVWVQITQAESDEVDGLSLHRCRLAIIFSCSAFLRQNRSLRLLTGA